MNKIALFFGIATLPLLVLSCSKTNEMDSFQSEERVTMIDPWTAIDQSPYKAPLVSGKSVTVTAGTEQTKAEMAVGETFAKVTWKAGDQYKMYAWNSTPPGSYYEIPFATTASGERVDFSTEYVTPNVSPWHNIYGVTPSRFGYDGDMFFGLNIPIQQEAVAGKVKDDYLFSYARTTEGLSGNLYFKSMLAYVRFKMSGTIANSVTSVKLTGASALAGDCTMIPGTDGTPQISFVKSFTEDVSSSAVTLTGTFAPDTYYYFAVAPGVHSSFSLTFSGTSGSTTKISVNTVSFSRGVINDLGSIALGSEFTDPATPSTATIKYVEATTSSPIKPVTIAVIPDGFTLNELPKYEMLAKSAINTLFSVEPFKTYKNYFNVYILKVASVQSGASITDGHGTITTQKNCYFGSKWGPDNNSYRDMEANIETIQSFVNANCPDITDNTHTIQEVPILMIINDSRYGGICHSSSDGFGYGMVPYTYEGGGIKWDYPDYEATSDETPAPGYAATSADRRAEVGSNSGNWLNTMVHEFGGHCFGRLADEYWSGIGYKSSVGYIASHRWDGNPYYGVPFGLNVSATYDNPGYDNPPGTGDQYIKEGWSHLLTKAESLPNTDVRKNRIGVFQGGDESIYYRWRSERISCMIDNRFYFSTFQRELIVKRIMSLAGATFSFNAFWANDKGLDPVRDMVSSPVMGEVDPVEPRPMPLLPPPVLHVVD